MRPSLQNGLLIFALAVVFVAAILLARHVGDVPARPAPPATSHEETVPLSPPAVPAPAAPATRAPVVEAKTVEVCGYGKVALDAKGSLPAALDQALAQPPALTRAISELAASTRAGDRAVALYLQGAQQSEQTRSTALEGDCAGNWACRRAANESAALSATAYTQSLTSLAASSDDPLAYAMAFLACRSGGTSEGCSAITAQRWAALEPDNAAPWLYLATDASNAKDTKLQQMALERAAQATRLDAHAGELLRATDTDAARAAGSYDRLGLHRRVAQIADAATPYDYIMGARLCATAADAAQHDMCSRLATRLVELDTNYLGMPLGRRMGAAMGWSEERSAALQIEEAALMGDRLRAQDDDPARALTCGALAVRERRNAATLKLGRVGASRAAIAQSGRPVAELAAEYRAWSERFRKSMQSNANPP